MTTQQIQDAISTRYDFTGSSISASSGEYTRRLRLINQAEETLKQFLHGQWSFLLTTTTLTTTPSQSYVTLPTDFERGSLIVRPDGFIEINSLFYRLVEYPDKLNYDSTENVVWITGDKANGFKLNIQPTPVDAYSIPIGYYSNAMATTAAFANESYLTNTTDITKIPDAYYLVDWVLGELYLANEEPASVWQPFKQSAQDRLITMAAHDGREQNQSITIKVMSEESGYDVFNSDGD